MKLKAIAKGWTIFCVLLSLPSTSIGESSKLGITVAALLPLTGPAAEHGSASLNGLQLGFAEAGSANRVDLIV